jgi:hypothetical protein
MVQGKCPTARMKNQKSEHDLMPGTRTLRESRPMLRTRNWGMGNQLGNPLSILVIDSLTRPRKLSLSHLGSVQ